MFKVKINIYISFVVIASKKDKRITFIMLE